MSTLFEKLVLIIALGAIAGYARGRGTSPVLVVCAGLSGYLLIWLVGRSMVSSADAKLAVYFGAWAWIGAVALFVRFAVGSGRPSPTGSWICTNCSFTNGQHANICEACQQPWKPAQ